MKKLLLALVAFAPLTMFAQSTTWNNDPAHTSINFNVTHLGIAQVAGKFDKFEGAIQSDKKDFTDAKINFTVDVTSVNTSVEPRDKHLKSDDFFSVEKYPTMKFVGTSLKKVSGNKYVLEGDLTIKDVTKKVKFDVVYGGTVVDPWGNNRAGFDATTSINRFDYHIDFGKDNNAVGKTVNLVLHLEFTQKKA
ncbi:polyisoprenoid-binding protein YceI [Chitinophaga skermanii]|uniref:Polyisoprenoid-binding protein YceI n=1 Tax=Chitinophaga skermanii TaxID=331697 RepID=A0A327Q647_9BACT|nr:YceI family protein [Chitinophaga skermanii]RAI99760.1 polyisoprenoid-binding protein YceI [Chitinophaga skermanii]